MNEDEKWMARCLQLARCGIQGAPPNPMVGAVLVYDGQIIGEGYHAHCGEGHAEVNAFASVKHPDLLEKAKMYVSLEPCAHYGRTPPCAKLIIDKGIRQVVVGMIDPFAKVDGLGIRMLREAGVEVQTGVLEKACRELNKKFITCQTHQRPFITLKWAQSADGFMAPAETAGNNIYISTPHTQIRTHHLRAEHQAILVGRHTAETDDPSLTVRYWDGRNPLRIALDRQGQLRENLHVFDSSAPTLIVGEEDPTTRATKRSYRFLTIKKNEDTLSVLFSHLAKEGIQSLLVEGGYQLLQSLIDQNLWDEAHIELGTNCFHTGLQAPTMPIHSILKVENFFEHKILKYQNEPGFTF